MVTNKWTKQILRQFQIIFHFNKICLS